MQGIFVLPSAGGGANPTLVQTASTSHTGVDCAGSVTLTFGSAIPNGHLIVIAYTSTLGAESPPSGFTQLGTPNAACQIFYRIA